MDRKEILEIVDFWPGRIILSAAELGLFGELQEFATAAALAHKLKVNPAALAQLLNALVALELLAKDGDCYSIAPGLEEVLKPGYDGILPMLEHRVVLWDKWSNLTDVVRSGTPGTDRYEDDERPQEEVESFIGAMAVVGRASAKEAAAALDLSTAKTLLDIGGGPAVYAEEFMMANPALRVIELDLPRVCEIARRNMEDSAVADRLAFVAGEALAVEHAAVLAPTVGEGYDVVFMSNLIHSMGPEDVMDLFRRCVKWVKPGGRIVVKDFLLDETGTNPQRAATFSINMLVCTESGRSYGAHEISVWLREAIVGGGNPEPTIDQIMLPDGTSSLAVATVL